MILMKWIKKLVLLFVLLSFGITIASCADPNGGGYKEDIDNHGRYKGEKSYDELLSFYSNSYEESMAYVVEWQNVMLASGLSRYYDLDNTLIDFGTGIFNTIKRDLSDKRSLEEIGRYLGIEDSSLKNIDYRFDYYYSLYNENVFSILKFYRDNNLIDVYYFPKAMDATLWNFNDLHYRNLFDYVFSDGHVTIDGTDFGLHLNSKVIPLYVEILGGRFYPYLNLYDFICKINRTKNVPKKFLSKDSDIKNLNYLQYYAASNRYEFQIYFNMNDLLNHSKDIHGIIGVKHNVSSNFNDKLLSKRILDDVFSFTLDASNGVENCKLKQLSLYN